MASWILLVGCFLFDSGEKAKQLAEKAEAQLQAGDLPGAAALYDQGIEEHPEDVDLATGAAFMALLQGDSDRADRILAAVEPKAAERAPEVALRRALVALEAGNLDQVKTLALKSQTTTGKLLAAEVDLADGEREQAESLLQAIATDNGRLANTAKEYLALIQDEDPLVAGLSEAQALWALGQRKVAVRSVEELLKSLEDPEKREEQLLLWAGRAAVVGEVEVARALLDTMIVAPKDQQWRKLATEALVTCAAKRAQECLGQFEAMQALPGVPVDGIADARATAAMMVAADHPEIATKLAGPYLTDGSARALHEAGASQAAWEASRSDLFAEFLRPGGG